jgi:hypothetical protein
LPCGRGSSYDLVFPRRGEVAQLVEHTTENRSVASSILALATIFSNNLESFEMRQP